MAADALKINWDHLYDTLREYAEDVVRTYGEKLFDDDAWASGKLMDVTFQIESQGSAIEVSLKLQEYWKYLEYGTKPHWPPRKALEQWIRIKPVIPYPGKNGIKPTERQLAYLIGRKIARDGTEPRPNLEKALTEVNERWLGKIEKAAAADLGGYVLTMLHTAFDDVSK